MQDSQGFEGVARSNSGMREHGLTVGGSGQRSGGAFPRTEWSLVLKARQGTVEEAACALERLCRIYWPAIYAFLRRQNHSPQDAEDLTQGFIACLLERQSIRAVDPAKGRFRSFLLGALKHFLADQHKHSSTQRRGGGQATVSLDDNEPEKLYSRLPAPDLPPDRVYDQQWGWRLLERALDALGDECARFGQAERFDVLKGFLTADPAKGDYTGLASRLRLNANTVAVTIHRLRKRYRTLVRREAMQTVTTAEELEDELRQLFGAG
jgi:RNA polymerase sigma factor (sigma-70 family)